MKPGPMSAFPVLFRPGPAPARCLIADGYPTLEPSPASKRPNSLKNVYRLPGGFSCRRRGCDRCGAGSRLPALHAWRYHTGYALEEPELNDELWLLTHLDIPQVRTKIRVHDTLRGGDQKAMRSDRGALGNDFGSGRSGGDHRGFASAPDRIALKVISMSCPGKASLVTPIRLLAH
jgi:ribosomal protein S27AE